MTADLGEWISTWPWWVMVLVIAAIILPVWGWMWGWWES